MVRVDGLAARFDRPLFDGLSFTVPAGEALAVTGPMGCGKSALLHVLGGDLEATVAYVRPDGSTYSWAPAG